MTLAPMEIGHFESFRFVETPRAGDAVPLGRRDYRWMHAVRECMWRATTMYPRHVVPLPEPRVTSPDEYRLALYIWTGELK